jgi:hypothetical protein
MEWMRMLVNGFCQNGMDVSNVEWMRAMLNWLCHGMDENNVERVVSKWTG